MNSKLGNCGSLVYGFFFGFRSAVFFGVSFWEFVGSREEKFSGTHLWWVWVLKTDEKHLNKKSTVFCYFLGGAPLQLSYRALQVKSLYQVPPLF